VDPPSYTVLVVDDDRSIRFLCRVNLELEGWMVREAATIEAARRELDEGAIDVVLLDVHVGLESGVEFSKEIRKQHTGVPVVFLTGSTGTESLERVEADAVISKPFTLEELSETVRNAARVAERAG
jgi:two-component system, OmpR family, response regulator